MKKIFGIVLILVFLSTFVLPANYKRVGASGTLPYVGFTPQSLALSVGQIFQVECSVNNVTDLYGLDIEIGWDQAIIRYVSHTVTIPVETNPGGILHSPVITWDNNTSPLPPIVAPGTMYFLDSASLLPASSFNGTGTCFMMTFQAIASGSAWINFTSVTLANQDGYVIPCTSENARVIIAPTVITATMNIYPQALNLASEGKWITVSIGLPKGYGVTDINLSSLLMNNTVLVAQPVIVGFMVFDGTSGLMIEFNRTSLVEYLASKNITYANVTLVLTGELNNGTLLVGGDIITVSALLGDVNCDGQVNILDVVQAVNSYGSKEGEPNWNPNANFAPPYDTISILDLVTIASHYGQKYT
jgi:hypothetical protein